MRAYAVGDEPVPGYQIIRPLGAGGYGTVWVARSPGDVEIALKIINLQGQGLKEFRAIGIVKRLRHPNLIPIYAFWLKDEYGNFLDSSAQDSVNLRGKSSELIIAMGLGDKSLAQRLEECKSAFAKKHGLPDTEASLIARLQELGGVDLAGLPIEELLEYMFGSARAIDYLNQPTHSLGTGPPSAIQHCDIKPGNLLIVSNDVQVCDYGLARVTGDARKTQAAGTPAYMAPELIAGKPSSGTDQYSFAITFYELRTGRLPFDESLAFHAHITGQMDFGLVTPTEQKILKQATHTRPDQRYPNTVEMVRALREALTPTRSPTPQSTPIIAQAPPSTSSSGVYRSGSSHPAASATPTVITKPTVLDDLIRAGVDLVPGHKLEALLGRGGYGEVWSATMPGKTKCALKIVRNLDATQGKQEFKSLDMIRDLDHDRLIRLQSYWLLAYDGSVIPDDQIGQPGSPKASALVVATDLAQQNLLQRWQECYDQGQAGIPVAELVPYMHQSAEAIDHLNFHEPAIVHRDIKPENILLTKNRQVKVSDFGLAKLVEGTSAAINTASVGMTLAYAAPELFRNKVTRWTDQYSLALTYYRLRTGRLPFEDGMGPIQMMQAHASGTLDFSGIGDGEQTVLRRACAVECEGRFGSCVEFVEALATAAGISRPNISTAAVIQSHPVSSGAMGSSSGTRWPTETARQPVSGPAAMTARFGGAGPSDAGSNIRETLRFEDPSAPSSQPSNWPPPATPQYSPHPHGGHSSGEFHLPDQRRGLPAGLMETTTNIPSSSEVDTAPDGSRQDWRATQTGPRPSGAGKKIAMAVAAAVVLVAGGIGAFLMTRKPADNGGSGGGSGGGDPIGPTLVERERKLATDVGTLVRDRHFGEAAQIVNDVAAKEPEKVAWQTWAVEQNAAIVTAWRQHAEGQPSPKEKRDEFSKLLASYPTDQDAKGRVAVLAFGEDNKHLLDQFAEALAKLREGAFPEGRAKLTEVGAELDRLGKEAPPGDASIAAIREQLDKVTAALTDLDRRATEPATEAHIGEIAKVVSATKPAGAPEYQLAIREAYRRVLGDKIEQIVPALEAATKWSDLLTACRTAATPSPSGPANPWAAACRGECAAELLSRGQATGGAEEKVAAPPKAPPPLAAYCQYVAASQEWAANPTSKAAAQALAALVSDTPESSATLLNDYRRGRILTDLRAAAAALRGSDPMAPYAGGGADAVTWLAAASRLAEKDPKTAVADHLRLKFDLTLAYMAAQPPQPAKARPLVEALVPDAAQKQWQPSVPEKVLLWSAFARTREATPAGRLAAVRADSAMLEALIDNLGGVPADYLYANLIRPLIDDGGRQILGDKPDREVATTAARLYFLAARNVRRYAEAWAGVKDLSDKDRAQLIVRLFERAAELDKQPTFVAWAGIAKSEMPGGSAGSGTGLTDDSIPAVALLRGIVLINEATKAADLTTRNAKWREADGLFRTGIDRCGKRPEFRDELVLLYQRAANNCIQLANIPSISPAEMSQFLDDAKGFADKLLALDSGRLEVYDTRGCTLEDMAWIRKDADRFGPKGKYAQAVDDFTTSTGGLAARATAFMHLGRCRFKWARDEFISAPNGNGKLDEEQLTAADSSLDEVFARTPESLEAAESHYWKAEIQLLRYAADGGMAKAAMYSKAAAEFKRAAGLAAKLKSAIWEEESLKAWAVAALNEASRKVDGALPGAADALADAVDRAEALKVYSSPWSAFLKMQTIETRERLEHVDLFQESLAAGKSGLAKCREQDLPIQFLIRMKLVDLRTSTLPSKSAHRKGSEALEDAQAGVALAEKAKLPMADLAQAHGAEGLAWFYSSAPLKTSDREEAKKAFEEACRLAPGHALAWKWKACLATIRSVEPIKTEAENATRLADTCRLYREADESLAAREKASRSRLTPEEALYKGYIDDFLTKTEGLAKPFLIKQINDESQADNPDRTKWQLSLAENLIAHKTDLPLARKTLSDAEGTVKKLPPSEQAFYQRQIDRIVRMLPKG